MAETYYGVIPRNPNIEPRQRVVEPPQLAERRLAYADPRVGQPYVIRTYLAPERDSGAQEEAAALTLLAELLGGSGTTSYFAKKLQFDTQTAVYSSAFYSGQTLDDTNFGLVIVPADGVSLEEAEAALDAAVAGFIEDGVDSAALDRIKMQIRASEIYEQDNISSLARVYGAALTSGLTVEDVEAWPDILAAVSEEAIMAAAKRVFDRKNAVTGWLTLDGDEEVTQ